MSNSKSIKKINIILIAILVLVVIIVVLLLTNNSTDKVVISSENSYKGNITNSNALTMMYETEAGSGEYQVSKDTSWPQEGYTFNETLSRCENGGKLMYNSETNRIVLQTNSSDKCYVYFDIYNPTIEDLCNGKVLSDCITNQIYMGTDGDNDLYYHDGLGAYINADQEAEDNSYRYSGANPNNYVCFGSDEKVCPSDNLYRIVGVFDGQVKLIKSDYANSNLLGTDGDYYAGVISNSDSDYYKGVLETINRYYWNHNTEKNIWSESNLNIVNLNINFINNIGTNWSNLIDNHEWIVGGNTIENIQEVTVKLVYRNEIINPISNTTYIAKIGLMYVSDYEYAANSTYWNYVGYTYSGPDYRDAINNNWMHMGLNEFTITLRNYNNNVHIIAANGSVSFVEARGSYTPTAVRPVFYLNSDVAYISGTGTQSDPFRIA